MQYLVAASDELLESVDHRQPSTDGGFVQETCSTLAARFQDILPERQFARKCLLVRGHNVEAMSEPYRVECSDKVGRSVIDDCDMLVVIDELSELFRQGSEVCLDWRSTQSRLPVGARVEESAGGGRQGEEGEGSTAAADLADELCTDEADADDADVEHAGGDDEDDLG